MEDPHAHGPVVEAGAPLAEADMALVLLHGRGAPAESMLPLAEALVDGLEAKLAIRAPQAHGGAWYPERFVMPREANQPWLDSALRQVDRVLDEIASHGIPSERTVLAGFSQGACLSLDAFARSGRPLGAVIALAGGLIGDTLEPGAYADDLSRTPVFIGSADPDPHIPTGRVEESAEALRAKGAEVDVRLYPGLGHTVNEDELTAARALLRHVAASGT